MKILPAVLCAAVAAWVLAAPAAQAFTFEKNASGDSLVDGLAAGARPYTDPGDKLEPNANRFDGDGTTVYRQGNTTLHFGNQRSFNDRFNSDDLFNPLRR
jgi:hypothetical protein